MQASYLLENDKLRVEVLRHGAELKSVADPATGVQYMWSGDKAVWGKYSPNLFPYIGNVAGGGYTLNGRRYPMTKHGFIRDLDFTEEEQARNRLTLSVTDSEATRAMYPAKFRFTVCYELVDRKLLVSYIVENRGTAPMHYNLGGHTGFSTSVGGANMSDYFLEFERAGDLITRRMNLASGLLTEETELVGENVKRLPLSKAMFDRDALMFYDLAARSVTLCCTKHEHRVKVAYDDFPTLAVWSMKGKGEFVCIEPWLALPDAELGEEELARKPDFASLSPGERRRYKYTVLAE